MDEIIGLGMFSSVFKVEDLQSDQQFAVKSFKKYYESLANIKCILPNINKFLSSLNHSKIVKYYGLIKTETEMNLFMELMNHGTLHDEIRQTGALDYYKIGRYCKDILEAVSFLHNKKILHRFIESKNILIDNNGGCKLTISSFSCSLEDDDNKNSEELWRSDCLYYSFVAPEIINNESLSYPYDIWWLGCTVIDMLTGEYLRYRWDLFDELNKIILQISNKKLQLFVQLMMANKSTERASADALLNHEFIRNESIDNSSNYQSINDNSRDISINIIENAMNNEKIGLSMGLKCNEECQHEFCLSSMTAANFKKGKIIEKGTFGNVYMMNFKSEVQYALKIIKIFNDGNFKEGRYLENDINQYRESIIHENIVTYYGSVRNFTKIFIFMEFIDGGSLYQRIKINKYNPFPLTKIKQYTKQIIKGLEFLHNSKIIHRDIKSANILINKNEIVKITGFGLSRFLRTISIHRRKSLCGTANYMSPEVINAEPYDCSADIWSLGATVYEMATGLFH